MIYWMEVVLGDERVGRETDGWLDGWWDGDWMDGWMVLGLGLGMGGLAGRCSHAGLQA